MSAQRKIICEGELLKRCRFAWSPRHVCLISMDDEQMKFQLLIYDQRQRRLKNSFMMDDISSVKPSKGNSFQMLLNRGGHPVVHFRSKSREELKNWMALLKVGMAKGNIFHVKVISKVNLLNEHALIRFFGYAEDGGASSRFMELYDPITDDPIYIWSLDKIRQFVRTDIGVRMDLCQRCFRSHQQPYSHTFMVPTYFLDKCVFFLCREVGSMHIFVSQTDNEVGTQSTVYQITTHNCGGRLNPPTSPPPPPPPPPPELPQKRTKKKQNPPIPTRDIPRRGYPNATDPLQGLVVGPVQPYVVSKRIHIDDHGNTLRLSEAAPSFPVPSYKGSPVTRPPPRRRSRTLDQGPRDSFWKNPLFNPSPSSSVQKSSNFPPANWREFDFENEVLPPLQQPSQHQPRSDSAVKQRGEEVTSSGTPTEDRTYYNWSRFRSTFNELATSPTSPFEKLAPPLPPRFQSGRANREPTARCPLRANQSMKVSDKRRSQDYFMEEDSIVGVVPSVDPFPSSESSEFTPTTKGNDTPSIPHRHVGVVKQRANTVDISEFDAFALDTMEGCTPERDIPTLSPSRPDHYSRTLHKNSGWEDVDAADAPIMYMNVPPSSYSTVNAPQYRNLSAMWVQGTLAEQLDPPKGVAQYQSSVGNHGDNSHEDHHHGDHSHSNNAQGDNHDGYTEEDSSAIQQQPSVDDVREVDSANASAEATESESFRVRDETGELSPVHTNELAPTSETAENPPHNPTIGLPLEEGQACDTLFPESSAVHDSPQSHRTPPAPPPRSNPAQNPMYVYASTFTPSRNSGVGVHSQKPAHVAQPPARVAPPPTHVATPPARVAPPPPPKPPIGKKPSINTASPQPPNVASTRLTTQSQRKGKLSPLQTPTHRHTVQHPPSQRPSQVQDSPDPPKPVHPTPAPRPTPEKIALKVTGNVAANGGHRQARLLANRTTIGCHGDESGKAPAFGDHNLLQNKTISPQAPRPSRTPPPPPPKPHMRTIYH